MIQIRERSELNVYFENGKKPPQENFWDWIFSFWHKNDLIPVSNIQGVNTYVIDASQTGAGTVLIPAGTLVELFTIEPTETTSILIGETAGGSEIISELNKGTDFVHAERVDIYYPTETTIYLTGNANFKIFTRS